MRLAREEVGLAVIPDIVLLVAGSMTTFVDDVKLFSLSWTLRQSKLECCGLSQLLLA
jgi:hypothetical protein